MDHVPTWKELPVWTKIVLAPVILCIVVFFVQIAMSIIENMSAPFIKEGSQVEERKESPAALPGPGIEDVEC